MHGTVLGFREGVAEPLRQALRGGRDQQAAVGEVLPFHDLAERIIGPRARGFVLQKLLEVRPRGREKSAIHVKKSMRRSGAAPPARGADAHLHGCARVPGRGRELIPRDSSGA